MNAPVTVTLKPCPFCGGEATAHWYHGFPSVACDKCSASTGLSLDGSQDQVITAWNTRAQAEAASAAREAALVEALEGFSRHTNWELSCDCWDTGEWQVFEVTGGRSDHEWHQIGCGETPAEAIRAALAKSRTDAEVG